MINQLEQLESISSEHALRELRNVNNHTVIAATPGKVTLVHNKTKHKLHITPPDENERNRHY